MTAKPLKNGATYDDLVRVPDHYVAEILDGDLYASPRPALPHARAATMLLAKLGNRFDLDRGGPNEWLLLWQPELHFGDDVIVPEVAGWRRERLPSVPNEAYLTLAPDWICEVVSAGSEYIDRGKKLRIYAREAVMHAWLVDPLRQSLEVLALESGSLDLIAGHHGNASVRARPFDAIELELRALWI